MKCFLHIAELLNHSCWSDVQLVVQELLGCQEVAVDCAVVNVEDKRSHNDKGDLEGNEGWYTKNHN